MKIWTKTDMKYVKDAYFNELGINFYIIIIINIIIIIIIIINIPTKYCHHHHHCVEKVILLIDFPAFVMRCQRRGGHQSPIADRWISASTSFTLQIAQIYKYTMHLHKYKYKYRGTNKNTRCKNIEYLNNYPGSHLKIITF